MAKQKPIHRDTWKSIRNFIIQNKRLHFNEKTIRKWLSMYWVITPRLEKLIVQLKP
jgi:hypothetical protein